jgi:hypothetical protein
MISLVSVVERHFHSAVTFNAPEEARSRSFGFQDRNAIAIQKGYPLNREA